MSFFRYIYEHDWVKLLHTLHQYFETIQDALSSSQWNANELL